MKYFISFFMILVTLSTQFSELMVFISFKMNQDYIAKNLCVEKDVEESTCMGCCQLEKRMTEQQDSKKEFPAPYNFKHDFTFCMISEATAHIEDASFTMLKGYSQFYTYTFAHNVFHPPKFFS